MEETGSWVEVARAASPVEGEVIRGLLESHGIRCLIRSQVVPHIHPYSVGPAAETIILVPASDAPLACALLEDGEEAGK